MCARVTGFQVRRDMKRSMDERELRQGEHRQFYRCHGPETGPLLLFVHGWPELSLSWRHQLRAFGDLGFFCVAPDLRGYGRSSVYSRHEDYALEPLVADMLALLDHLGREQAILIGHDWGSPVVWSLAAHHPQRCLGVASLCVPYRTLECGLDAVLAHIDREVYPVEQFPAGQWEYMRYYEENFAAATGAFDADPYRVAKLLFRKGDPAGAGQPSATAFVRANGGWFGGGEVPDLPIDEDVVSADELQEYADGLRRNGFFGPDSYYMNHSTNAAYAVTDANAALAMPVLFLAAQYDYTCETIVSTLAEPMRGLCGRLTEEVVFSGHWMAQERPRDVNSALARWLAREFPDNWWRSAPAFTG